MATAARGLQGFKTFLEMIKVEHSVFALPFAFIGMMLGSVQLGQGPFPGWTKLLLIIVAMVSARSAAMAYNRIADREIDAVNPRTKSRAIPAGLLSLRTANIYFFGSVAVFFFAAGLLNWLALLLSPVALLVTLGYSQTKRFTPLCHFVLGLSLGIAPAAAWIGVTGSLHPAILPFTAAVLFWTAGFDIIYSLQDEQFDRDHGLRSLPQTIGVKKALTTSRICHVIAVLVLFVGWYLAGLGSVTVYGIGFVTALLVYEQSLVSATDLSKVNMAFFTVNGFVSIGFFLFVLADLVMRK